MIHERGVEVALKEMREQIQKAGHQKNYTVMPVSILDRWMHLLRGERVLGFNPDQMTFLEREVGTTRATDPDTSREAAESIPAHKLSKLRREIMWILLTRGPMTDREIRAIVAGYGHDYAQSTTVKRRGECVEMGWIRDTGEIKKIGRMNYIVWDITDEGNRVLREGQ